MKKFSAGLIALLLVGAAPTHIWAQDTEPAPTPAETSTEPAKDAAAEESEEEGDEAEALPTAKEAVDTAAQEGATEAEQPASAAEKPAAEKPTAEKPAAEKPAAEKPATRPAPKPKQQAAEPPVPDVNADQPFGEGFEPADDAEFVPLEEITEGGLEQIVPAKVHPRVEWDGTFRTRVGAAINWDLDTQGTSAILPPVETFTPTGNPAAPDRDTHWDANLRLKLDPTIFISEAIRVRTELDLLDNVVFGSMPANRLGFDGVRPDLSGRVGANTQFSAGESRWFDDALKINELYGEVDTLLGRLSAGRMDDHWGLGMFVNDGDCMDCDYGSHVDRFKFQTKVWELYGSVSVDFPDEGVTSKSPFRTGGVPYDLSQRDDVDQYSFQVFRSAQTREEKELEGKRLLDDQAPVVNGGAMYRFRRQEGRFLPTLDGNEFDPTEPGTLIYRGERVHVADLWVQFLYQPDFDTRVRIELEGMMALGSVDNVTDLAVGQTDSGPVNCFDKDQRLANEGPCTTNNDGVQSNRNIQQFGLALESEFQLDSPVSFGFNGGFASGGPTSNWGLSGGPDYSFYRFNSDYHVDLILFRNVIGTVTNAYYFNPYAMVKFLESSSRHLELEIDAIGSRAFDSLGTPSGQNPWLGLEFDGAFRFVNHDIFTAALEAGILFPFAGLNGVPGQPRLVQFGSNAEEFNNELSARIAWTVQAKLFWNF